MKLKIDNTDLSDEFFSDVRTIGIVSSSKGYNFCWSINQFLSIDFRSHPDLEVQLEKRKLNYYFNIYSFIDSDQVTEHYLYENESRGEYLVPEYKHLDYIWLIRSDTSSSFDVIKLIQHLREIEMIQLATELSIDRIKSRENLII